MGFVGSGFVGILTSGTVANSDGGAMVVVVLWWLGLSLFNFFMEFLMWVCNEIFEVDFVGFSDGSTLVLLYMVVPWIFCMWWCCGGILPLLSMLREKKIFLLRLMCKHKKHG